MKKLLFLSILLAGCQTVSDVIPVGKDTYMVGANVRGGMNSDIEVTALSVRKANEGCAAQSKRMELMSSSNSGTQGWTPQQSQVMFRCM